MLLEIGAEDMASIASYSSTAAWLLGLVSATFLSWVKQMTGSWRALFLLPVRFESIEI